MSDLVGRGLSRVGLSADMLTAMGVVLSGVAAWRIAVGAFVQAGILLALGGFLDFCDGAVARVRGTASRFGAFLDSVTDRFSDAFIFSAFAWFYFSAGDELMAGVSLFAYGTAVITSYVRAKAESLGYDCRVGILERAERVIVLCAGLILGFAEVGVWAVAILGTVTVAQRLVRVAGQRGQD